MGKNQIKGLSLHNPAHPPIPAGQSTACESCKPVEKIQHGAGGVRFRAGATGGEQSEMPPVGAPTTPTGGGTGDGNRVLCSHAGHSIGGCDSFSAWPGAVGRFRRRPQKPGPCPVEGGLSPRPELARRSLVREASTARTESGTYWGWPGPWCCYCSTEPDPNIRRALL